MKEAAKKYDLGSKDFVKGLIVAILTVFLTGITASLDAGVMPTLAILKTSLLTGIGAGVAYLLKNFLTTSDDKFMGKEKTLMIIGFILLSSFSFASDTLNNFDSTKLHNGIVSTANVIINAVPDVNVGVSVVKVVLISLGSLITGWCIRHFRKK